MNRIRKFVKNNYEIIMPLFCSFFCLLVAFAIGREATPEQRAFMRERARLVSRDTGIFPGHVVSYFRKGNKTWSETNKISIVNEPVKYRVSKLKLITNLKGIQKWVVVKKFITDADFIDEWDACQYIDTRYPAYITATNEAVKAGLATSKEIDRIISLSWDD